MNILILNWQIKLGFGIGCIIVALVIFGVTNSGFENETSSTINESDSTKETNYSPKTDYRQAIKLVQDFRGTDESGSTVTETVVSVIQIAYGNEPIFDNLSTKFSWDGLRSFDTPGNAYDVYIDFKAYDGNLEFHFIVDMDSKTIWAGNELASNILKVVEAES